MRAHTSVHKNTHVHDDDAFYCSYRNKTWYMYAGAHTVSCSCTFTEAGDCFFAVDGVNISTLSRQELVAIFDGKPGAKLELSMCPPPATKPPDASGAPQRQLHTNGAQREQNTQQRAAPQQPASSPHPHPPTALASKPMMHHHKQPIQLQSAKTPLSTAINLKGTLTLPLSALSSCGREHTLSPGKTRPSIEVVLMAFCDVQMCWAPPLPRELKCMTAEISRAVPPCTGKLQMLPWAYPLRPRTKGCAYALGCRARQATISQNPLCSEVVQDTN